MERTEQTGIDKTAMFTGHRHIAAAEQDRLRRELPEIVADLSHDGIRTFISGAAIGFDTLAAQSVRAARAAGLPVFLTLAVPCLNQDALWQKRDRSAYAALLKAADKVVYTSYTPYYDGCMQLRNRYMVENAAVCVAYFNGEKGGTASTCQMARSFGRRVFNLCSKEAETMQLRLSDLPEAGAFNC